MPSADQVPVKSTHSMMLWPWWVVLIAGSTGAALVLFALPTVTSHPDDHLAGRIEAMHLKDRLRDIQTNR
jgi:hypothetical protein